MEFVEKQSHNSIIELLAYWQGRVNATDLVNYYQRTRQQARKYIQSYQAQFPQNLHYQASIKGFVLSEGFTLQYISGNVDQYLSWLSQSSGFVSSELTPSLTDTSLSLPKRQVSPFVMRGLIAAIKQKRRIDVDYVSLANPNYEGRIIQPFMFVKTGLRWHLRAYDEQHQQFRDFVLSRFSGDPELLDKANQSSVKDESWHTYINLIFEADSRLTAAQKTVIQQDYQMQKGQLIVNCRAALAQYLLQEMQVKTKFHDEYPEAQQLVLVNKSNIKQWLFNA